MAVERVICKGREKVLSEPGGGGDKERRRKKAVAIKGMFQQQSGWVRKQNTDKG
jgi:hypothetical protein